MDATTTHTTLAAGQLAALPGSHVSPVHECGHLDPENEAAASALRAYVPAETMREISRISREECAACDIRQLVQQDRYARIASIKEQMKRLRQELKHEQWLSEEYARARLFPRTDAARSAAWRAAAIARAACIARGETPRYETAQQAGERARAVAVA